MSKVKTILARPSVGKDVDQLQLSYIASGNLKMEKKFPILFKIKHVPNILFIFNICLIYLNLIQVNIHLNIGRYFIQ